MIAFPDSASSLPGSLTDSRSSDAGLEAVRSFAERLAELSPSDWVEVGNSLLRDASAHATRATASALLVSTINGRGLDVAAWYACDAIETSAFYVSRPSCSTPSDRRAFAAAHAAAEDAALALLAREFLPASDYEALCDPFITQAPRNRADIRLDCAAPVRSR
ncbi:MAG TPA: hypothetical protein VGQ44_01075 [Gemmatimonadaceae bacterium]|jgi:hypothetical protein|nr:hypothetical protein [Gemmatimonadaceae bacterium]